MEPPFLPMMLNELKAALRAAAKPGAAEFLQGFFKTGAGEYGEGDVFIGVRVPALRTLSKEGDELALADILTLLHSQFHEERLLALMMLVRRFERGAAKQRESIFNLYLREARWINNWDLVDLSAPKIVGPWLVDHPRGILQELVQSANIWERRIAVVATYAFIRLGQFDDTLALCESLLLDRHDLIHKACGWMLREVGKRDESVLTGFLDRHASRMPRTMLRYAIERLPEAQRKAYLAIDYLRHKAAPGSKTDASKSAKLRCARLSVSKKRGQPNG